MPTIMMMMIMKVGTVVGMLGCHQGRPMMMMLATARWSACSVTMRRHFKGQPMMPPIKVTTVKHRPCTDHHHHHHRMLTLEGRRGGSPSWASFQGNPHGSYQAGVTPRALHPGVAPRVEVSMGSSHHCPMLDGEREGGLMGGHQGVED